MKSKKAAVIAAILIFSIVGAGLYNLMHKDVWDVNAELLKEEILSIDEQVETINLASVTPFEWDVVYAFNPYTPKEAIYETVGYKWDDITETINEGINQIVFLNDGEVVCYVFGYPQNNGYPIPKNGEENNIYINNNPPISPQGDDVCVSEPKHKPERFSKLWSFYPHSKRGSKQRAMRAWDKLKPSDELIDTIAKALMRQLRTDEWSRGIGVPHLSSYLNGRLWLDAEEIDEVPAAAMFETDDVEVLPLWT